MSIAFASDEYAPEPAKVSERMKLEEVPGQPPANFVLCRTCEEIDRVSRGERIQNPNLYAMAAGQDKLMLLEVVRNGLGAPIKGRVEDFVSKPGDIAMLLENRISYRIQIRGERHFLIRNNVIAGLLNQETFGVKATNHYVLVKPNEERALAFESRQGLGTRKIWVPTDQVATDDEQASKLRRPGLVAAYGEVVDVGPGLWDDGTWKAPQCRLGQLIFFDSSHSTLSFHVKGEPRTLVPCDQIALIADEG